ncbi:MAG: PhoH family protein [Flammeovirgaceae bacterium]
MPAKKKQPKIFVLDTSVILYDADSITSFQDNDIVLPISVLEELDTFKKGSETKNFEARQCIRFLDELSAHQTLSDWVAIGKKGAGKLKVYMNEVSKPDACQIFNANKADHRILNVAINLQTDFPDRKVIVVSKDANLRLKAKSLNLAAEDYETGKVKDIETLFTGKQLIEGVNSEVIDALYKEGFCKIRDIGLNRKPLANQYFILKNGNSSALAFYNPNTSQIERVSKQTAYGVTPRNAEQVFALHAIQNPDVKLITLQGVAGSGKTLLAIAGALSQTRDFHQIYVARPIVPLSNKDIGYLPGDVKDKIGPYMEPLFDNLKVIKNHFKESDKEYKKIDEMVQNEKIVIAPLAYIRGRSLANIIFIVDEAQNLTPHEVKTIITRAGDNTKIIFTGDIKQIDTPYLDMLSNGLSYLIDRLKGNPIVAHVTLEKGERSELANLANDLL